MKKAALLMLAVLLLLPMLATAANMQVNSSAVPVSGGTISPNGIKFYTPTSTDLQRTYTATPKSGWTVAGTYDGAPITFPFVAPFDTTKVHILKANYTQTKYNITTTVNAAVGSSGTITITGGAQYNITPGSTRGYTVTPSVGSKIVAPGIIINGSASPSAGTFTNIQGNISITANFGPDPVANLVVYAGPDQTVGLNVATLTGTTSVPAPPYQWNLVSGPAGSIFSTPTALTTGFLAGTPGTYVVTLTASGVTSPPATITAVYPGVVNAGSTTCNTCHAGSAPVAAYPSSIHALKDVSCSTCHNPSDSPNHPSDVSSMNSNTCATCHSGARTEVSGSYHWNNHLEYGPEFTGGAVEGQLNANDSYTTKENGTLVTCAYRCHFRPGMYPAGVTPPSAYVTNKKATTYVKYVDSLNNKTYTRPGGDECFACHDSHNPKASYQTCLTCHTGSKHGLVPNEFWGSKHWQNNFEYDPLTQRNQIDTTVAGGNVKNLGTHSNGVLNANDSYDTEENSKTDGSGTWAKVTCAYRCHFRPGMGPQKDVAGVLAAGKSTGYITYTDTTGKYGTAGKVYSRPGGNACIACHNEHALEATAQSTCYTCHAGGNHGWSVAAFEKSTHFSGAHAGTMRTDACLACHNAHSTEAEFANLSTAKILHSAGIATGCQKCHTVGSPYGIFNADRTGKAPHFQTGAPINPEGFYATGSYDGGGATCIDCHYHNNSINADWAKGGHASTTSLPLVTSKDDNWNRGTKKGATISTSPATTYGGDYTKQASVSDCQRCHTAAGFKLFYDSAFKNVSTAREGFTTSAPITCDACHVPKTAGTNLYAGTVRPLAIGVKAVRTYVGNAKHLPEGQGEVTTFMNFSTLPGTGYKNSNVCIPCHAGRGTGDLIKATFAKGSESTTLARDIIRIGTDIYAHFASAAGVVNGSSAYTFSSAQVYQDRQKHKQIGTLQKGAAYGTTSSTMGPCVGCHMTSTEGHSLEAVTYAADGKIDGFATPVCTGCHATGFTAADVQAKKEEFEAALNVLRNLLLNRGIDGLQAEIDARPGERVTMDMSVGFANYSVALRPLSKKDFAERNTGAAFNWWQFGKTVKDGKTIILGDPAAYVHNPAYARRIIFDSIDWLDDFKMNGSAANTILAQANAPVKTYGGVADGVVTTPDAAAKAAAYTTDPGCLGCHFAGSGIVNVGDGKHYNTTGALVPGQTFTKAQYVVTGTQCNYCHGFGHGTDSPGAAVIAAYAESAHGETNGLAWTDYNFLNLSSRSACTPCHTTQGFVNAVTTANANGTGTYSTPAFIGNANDTTKQVLGCNACHSSTTWKGSVRTVTGGYTLAAVPASSVATKETAGRAAVTFPPAGESDSCIVCHSGRVTGAEITAAATGGLNFSNTAFKNSHYLASAGIMYMKAGFHDFTDPSTPIGTSTYGKSYSLPITSDGRGGVDAAHGGVAGGVKSAHRALGTDTITLAEAWITDPATLNGNKGPCVTCHVNANMTGMPAITTTAAAPFLPYSTVAGRTSRFLPALRTGAGHSFSAVSAEASAQTCMPCHNDAQEFDAVLNVGNFALAAEEKLAEAKPYFLAGLAAIKQILRDTYAIDYDPGVNPYFFEKDQVGVTAVTDWTRNAKGATLPGSLTVLDNSQAAKLMGACFNLNVLTRDPGAYVHGRSYTQRLIFDTIDYLNDLTIDQDAAATLMAINPTLFPDTNDHWLYKAAGARK